MIEGFKRQAVRYEVFRLGNPSHVDEFAKQKGLSVEDVREIVAFSGEELAEDLINGPFKSKPLLRPLNLRYSDGRWSVFYSALERVTAEKEVMHHYAKDAAGHSASPRDVYYLEFACTFAGETIDLRPKLKEWPDLVSDDYRFCQNIAEEAHNTDLDAFLAPSARKEGGTTVPVFFSRALSDPHILTTKRFTFDPKTMKADVYSVDN